MDLVALARARQAALRVGVVLIMVGAMIVGTEPTDWLAQCIWIAAYASAVVGAAILAVARVGASISPRRWQLITVTTDVIAIGGFQLLSTGGYVPLLVVALLPLMVILELSWQRAGFVLAVSVAVFVVTVLEDRIISNQLGWPETWFLVALYVYLCSAAFLATYAQAREVEELTRQRVETQRFEHLATHDALTGLPNRSYVLARISDALSREGNSGLSAVLFMDLDKLKAVNDSLGHEAGDQMIRVAAHRLQLVMGPDDVAARLGGDEFVALLFGLTGRRELDDVSARLHTALAEPTRIADTTMGLSASIGVTAVDAHDERDAAAILHDADVAMYQAKTTGIGTSHAVDKQPPAEPQPAPRD